nr:hypothetical protein [Kribbella sp. VKM Ac-2568]
MRVRPMDGDGLRQVEQWLAADLVGGAIFGGFYGHAVARWTPLLQAPSRHGWLTSDDEGPVGFIDLEILDGEAEVTYYLSPAVAAKAWAEPPSPRSSRWRRTRAPARSTPPSNPRTPPARRPPHSRLHRTERERFSANSSSAWT